MTRDDEYCFSRDRKNSAGNGHVYLPVVRQSIINQGGHMKYQKSIVAISIALGLGMAGVHYATDAGGGQGGMQKQQQKDAPSIPDTVGTTEGRGDRFGESGSGQGSGGGTGTQSGIGTR